jgi:hypothetical protein
MKLKQIIGAACLLMFAQSHAQAPDPQAPDADSSSTSQAVAIPKLVAGIARQYKFMGKSLSTSCYTGSDKMLDAATLLVVAGYETCKRSYSEPKGFYVVFQGLQKYYIAEADLELSEQEAESVKSLSEEQKAPFSKQAEISAIYLRKQKVSEVLDTLKRHKKHGLTVVSSAIADVSEHTEGTSFSIEVLNQAEKSIKYVWFTVVGYNAVGDPVRSRSGASATVKGIGPIAPGASASYEWDYLWHTDIVETFKIPKIKIQYMDGSFREVQNIKAITLSMAHRITLKEAGDN